MARLLEEGGAAMMDPSVDVAPLVAAVDRAGGIRTLTDSASDWRSYARAKARGTITTGLADRLSIQLLGINPALLWGPAWWDSCADTDDLEDVA